MPLQYRIGFVVIVAAVAHLVIAGPCVGKVNRHDTLLMPVTRSTFSEHFAVCRVQCSKERGRSVTPIIMSHSFHIPQSQRQHLGAFHCLNSALLIYAQNYSILRGIQMQPYKYPVLFLQKLDH